ncbi:MAG: succinyl-diaminopimelate desuccinylase [Actinomycetes bacterium]
MVPPGLDPPVLDLYGDVVALTAALVDISSVSGCEARLADALAQALGTQASHLRLDRDGDTLVARSTGSRSRRVLLAGHLDTVPVAGNLPHWRTPTAVYGRGSVDMKGGVAVLAHLAATLVEPSVEVTYVFYDHEEVDSARNGLGRVARTHPEWLAADVAVLGEPTNGLVEGGCNGTLRAEVTLRGRAAHSARAWMGRNAIHAAGAVLSRLEAYVPTEVQVDGLVYREGLSAVGIRGGVAGNVVPDECVVTVNYRFAPSRTTTEAERHVRDVFGGYEVRLTDIAPGARPGLDDPLVGELVAAVGAPVRPKYGWTDVARFAGLGIPAVNYGPGDPALAHADDEHVEVEQIRSCVNRLATWLN